MFDGMIFSSKKDRFSYIICLVFVACHPHVFVSRKYSSALAALYHNKRVKKGDQQNCQEAEKLLLKAIAKDDLYFPAYLSLATLYIYRMKLPDKALEILELAKDRGPLSKVEPLLLDAKALKIGGNDTMVQMGGVFAQEEYLSPPSNRYGS